MNVTWVSCFCHGFKNVWYSKVICRASCGLPDFLPQTKEKGNIYLDSIIFLMVLLFSPRTPKKQSSFCPSFSGQVVLKLWWSMCSVVLVSSCICQRKLALSPSCLRVSLLCYVVFWKFFLELRSHPWRSHALLPTGFSTGLGAHVGASVSDGDMNTELLVWSYCYCRPSTGSILVSHPSSVLPHICPLLLSSWPLFMPPKPMAPLLTH